MSMSDTDLHPFAPRLLVIDDDPAVRILLAAIFRCQGFVVESAGDGVTALRRLRRESWDAVVADLMLPDPNGFEIIRELKSHNPALLRRMIVLTAAADPVLRDFSDGALVRRVVAKPFEVGELLADVLSCLPAAPNVAFEARERYVH